MSRVTICDKEISRFAKPGMTQDKDNTNAQLRNELGELRRRVGELAAARDQQKRVEETLSARSAVLNAVNQVFQEALTCETEAEVAATCLKVAEQLTGSKFGFIGEVNEAGRFDTIAISNPGWDACKMPRSDATRLIVDMEIRGLWAGAILDESPIIVNDPATHPHSVGTPAGHPPITCFLGVPLKHGGRTIGMFGLANKQSGYEPADRQAVEALSVSFVEALMRKRAEAALRRHREELEKLVEERTEEVVRTLKELEQSNTDLEQFATVASHDLQEPLRMVSSFVQLLAKRYEGRLDAKADEMIGFAVDGTKRMKQLIDDLLRYSRVGSRGKSFEPVAVNEVVDEAMANLEAAILSGAADITHDDLPTVIGDRSQLVQLFQNLIANAIKFHRDEPPRVHISAERSGDEWVFSVQDNGIGIDRKYTEQVFAIFQRLHARTEYPGTGVGLPICRRIAERHGGRIRFESQVGKGTTFFVTIPESGEAGQDGRSVRP